LPTKRAASDCRSRDEKQAACNPKSGLLLSEQKLVQPRAISSSLTESALRAPRALIRISSAMLVRESRTSSANGAWGRHERQDSAGMRLVTAARAPLLSADLDCRAACFVVRDHNGQQLAYVYFEDDQRRNCSHAMKSDALLPTWRSFPELLQPSEVANPINERRSVAAK
jgi:hypothetical protein